MSEFDYAGAVRSLLEQRPGEHKAFVHTYGCQQNFADSEKLEGILEQMGYTVTHTAEGAEFVIFNTCAIRENAEQRVFGNVGILKKAHSENPDMIIAVCGCMVQQEHIAKKFRQSYPFVDIVFGTHAAPRLPELVYKYLTKKKRLFDIGEGEGCMAEYLPVHRDGLLKANLPIMHGCDNFCTYCVVPLVRGREKSRLPENIIAEAKEIVAAGYKEITLLGQNVNSYGKDLEEPMDFADLLEQVNAVPGDFLIRFMTSHPKDATQKLFETMARCEKVAPVLHLPFQAGNDRILKAMNRRHTRAQYLEKIAALKALIPDIVLTSDIIVGFPGETTEEFEDTLKVLEQVRFDALFTFIYSPRVGTPAAKLPDPMSREEKLRNFNRLTALQDQISAEKHAAYIGKTLRCLMDGESGDGEFPIAGRTPGNRLVRAKGSAGSIGQFCMVKITGANKWSLFGEII